MQDKRPYSGAMNTDQLRRKLGERLRAEREQQSISQRSFALMIGISQPYLSAVESGSISIGYDNLCKIADGLGVTVAELVS